MLNLIWRETALDDLKRIALYIAQYDFDAAIRIQQLIEERAERLAVHPHMYRPGRLTDTREVVVHPNYIVVYRVGIEMVEIVNVLHSRRNIRLPAITRDCPVQIEPFVSNGLDYLNLIRTDSIAR